MSLEDTMTSLMDKFREKTNLTDKLSIQRATSLMDHLDLHVNPNLLSNTSFDAPINVSYPMWSYVTLPYDLEPGKTYTFSWQAKTDGSNKTVRIRVFNSSLNLAVPSDSPGIEFPLTQERKSYTWTMPADASGYNVCLYGSAFNENEDKPVTFYKCKLEVGDLATPLTESGATQSASSATQPTQPAASSSNA